MFKIPRPNLLLIGAVLTCLSLTGCGDRPSPGWTGYAEAELVYVAAPVAGRLAVLSVRSGQAVQAGQPLFELDAASELAADAQAQARARSAQAQADNADKGRRMPELNIGRAQADQAHAAERQAAAELGRQQQLAAQGFVAQARVDDAQTAWLQARARVAEQEAALSLARLPARDDERRSAQALAQAAQQERVQTAWRVAQLRQAAPQAAQVQDVFMRPGEWVPAGQPVLALLPPAHRKARFYVPQSALPSLPLDAPVQLHCDGCGAPIAARISYVAAGPEYTPPVIYSNQQRDKLVFLVEARPLRPEDAQRLHPGQPLDVQR